MVGMIASQCDNGGFTVMRKRRNKGYKTVRNRFFLAKTSPAPLGVGYYASLDRKAFISKIIRFSPVLAFAIR